MSIDIVFFVNKNLFTLKHTHTTPDWGNGELIMLVLNGCRLSVWKDDVRLEMNVLMAVL